MSDEIQRSCNNCYKTLQNETCKEVGELRTAIQNGYCRWHKTEEERKEYLERRKPCTVYAC